MVYGRNFRGACRCVRVRWTLGLRWFGKLASYEAIRMACVVGGGFTSEESEVVRGEVHRNDGSVWERVWERVWCSVEARPLGFSRHMPWSMSA